MMNNFFKKHSYYVILVILSTVLLAITILGGIDKKFFLFYAINYNNINTAVLTIFGGFFAFIFTVLAILFSLKEDSSFFKLIKKNNRNKIDVINYFTLALLFLFLVSAISFFLIITYVGNTANIPISTSTLVQNMSVLTQILIYALIYLMVISFANVLLLVVTFITILRSE
ncbi:MAG: hypothetical protein M1603_03110 [Candidatus Marsarchaeota archaeon]|nr:hypothetical protein [Candidatus Marsarchaeota archaeon]